MDVYKYLDNEFDTIFTESLYEDYYTFGSEILDEGSNIKYFKYVTGHIGNVKKGYRWLKKYLPELFDNQNRFRIAVTMALHDRSKFLLNKEFKSYRDYFYGDEEKLNKETVKNNFDKAWNHHQKINKHHWQYWVLVKADGSYQVLDMPYENIIEMICDWWSFSWKTGNLYDVFSWYDRNKNSMILSNKTRSTVEMILKKIRNKLDELKNDKKSLSESVLDPIRKTRCPDLFEDPEAESPKLKPDVLQLIKNTADKFIKDIDIPEAKIEQLFIVGSSLGFQYRDDSDIDVDLRINIPKEQMWGKFSLIPKGIVLPNTEHPVNIFLLTSDSPEYNFDKDAENAYDVLTNTWIKQSTLENSSQIPYAYLSGISEFLMDGMTLQLQRAERDIRELRKYISIDPNVVSITEKEKDEAISNKISDLLIDKDALNLAHRIMFRLDSDGFNDDPISISIDYTYESRHFSMNNLIYKYIDSFKYYDKINDMIKEINAVIELGQNEIKKNTADETPEGQNKEEIQNEIEEVKEDYTDDELSTILVENGYEPTEHNLNVLKKNLNTKYFIVDESYCDRNSTLVESLISKTEKYINKRIFKSSKKWPVGKSTLLGMLLAGLPGMFIAQDLAIKHNSDLDEDEIELYDRVKNDPECQKIISEIKNEIYAEKPNRENLKSLKKEYAAVVKRLALEMKKEQTYNLDAKPYISLKKGE